MGIRCGTLYKVNVDPTCCGTALNVRVDVQVSSLLALAAETGLMLLQVEVATLLPRIDGTLFLAHLKAVPFLCAGLVTG